MSKHNKGSLTVGIPAHNEEKNIHNLLTDIKKQLQTNYELKQVILVLDGSTDNTLSEAKRNDLSKLKIHQFKTRQGKSEALEFIQSHSKTDLLMLFDADVEIRDKNFINKLVEPILVKKADLTSAKIVAKRTDSIFNEILYLSNEYKQTIYQAWNEGNNLYTCHGRSICLSKKLYSKINYKGVVADDALAYVTALHLGLKYAFVKEAKVFYQLPQTFDDHAKQSVRFLKREKQFSKYFDSKFVKKQYRIPLKILVPATLQYLFYKPVNMSIYILLFIYLKILSLISGANNSKWSIAKSSKVW
ncbi:MAG: hypothetical protein COU81_00665 [Candidatus Portnoybacteria bacterium CG10_big_fil_rev_8_21_14_0_10_36_7]|uniref:Glycosyltransferase 2-like domain-containing protein n=1 Tax=Candidatus Portnoybacteria bacterium CG10_big_fil_rev_8_21_14_0_10_36_7 TaxID=1974812 RepID=A0A2M8KEW9_9BACT|nr:MAG: hypothetical protein COU81_00665 [Candidatus Portnoybacteria bacterium CG10_big_fil_rev_8_21_14_0_10_36_7]